MPWRLIRTLFAAFALLALAPIPARADPGDVDAASRGVVRIVLMEEDDNGELTPVAHGTGFAVTPERIVTNAHVVADAQANHALSIGIVPSDGGEAVYGRLIAYSPRNDLALIATTSPMKLSPLTIAGTTETDSAGVTSVGYPMNVDRAQGLGISDIFRAQPPVKSRGFLSGRRPSRDFDTLLHTAPIGRGSSGGPLLDDCGRVVGVNSFGAESGGADSEFYFAVSNRELLPFLRANDIVAQVNGLPCRSMAELDEEERARAEREQLAAQREQEVQTAREAERTAAARREVEFALIAERENAMMLSLLLVIGTLAGGFIAWQAREEGNRTAMKIASAVAGVALAGAAASWLTRPGFGDVDDRVAQFLAEEEKTPTGQKSGVIATEAATEALSAQTEKLVCVVNVERSRITTGETADIPFTWSPDGCVNSRTQYGLKDGKWSRILVPNSEAAVSVNSYDPAKHEYRIDRYLLGHDAMAEVRKARGQYTTPACGAGEAAARDLGSSQAAVSALLPAQPNERVIYDCRKAE